MKEPILFYSIIIFIIIVSCIFLVNIRTIAIYQTIKDFLLFSPHYAKPDILEFENATVILSSKVSVLSQP